MRTEFSNSKRLVSLGTAAGLALTCLIAAYGHFGDDQFAIAQTGRETVRNNDPKKGARKPTAQLKKGASDTAPAEAALDEEPVQAQPPMEYETVKLADGTEVKVEKWGDTFLGYDAPLPIDLDDSRVEEFVNTTKVKNLGMGIHSIQIDAEAGRIYWCNGYQGHPVGHIVRANLDGTNVKNLASDMFSPRNLALDRKNKRLYWIEGPQNTEQVVKGSDLDGKDVTTLARKLKNPGGLTLDVPRAQLYYWEEDRIIRINTDGTGEVLVAEGRKNIYSPILTLELDPVKDQLYWAGVGDSVFRGNLDGSQIGRAFQSWGDSRHFTIDSATRKIYWTNQSYDQLLRANLDGSQQEILFMEARRAKNEDSKGLYGSVAIDSLHRKIYWSGGKYIGSVSTPVIWRAALPPILRPHKMPAPPLIKKISPAMQKAGQEITLVGNHFDRVSAVSFVDDSTRRHIAAKYAVADDRTVRVTVPKLGEHCNHPMVILQTPSGVTMTLTRNLKVVNESKAWKHDRFREGVLPQIWQMPRSTVVDVEYAVVYAEQTSKVVAAGRGENTIFTKSGSGIRLAFLSDSVMYHEPFVIMTRIDEVEPTLKLIPVPAIRASFLDELMNYDAH